MKSFGLTNIGLIRKINEDAFYCSKEYELANPYVCIVADGMGGHNAGEVASRMAINEVVNFINNNVSKGNLFDIEDYKKLVRAAIEYANRIVYKQSLDNDKYIGMGTTLTTVLIINEIAIIGHVGDSRVYLIRDKTMEKITNDHSYVAELIKNGTIKPEEAKTHPQKNLITRAVGTGYDLKVDIETIRIRSGDFILMCTDGLYNFVSESLILDEVLANYTLEQKCGNLIKNANDKGGYDNITVVIIQNQKGGANLDR